MSKRKRRTKNAGILSMIVDIALGIVFTPCMILVGIASVIAAVVGLGLVLLILAGIIALFLPIIALL